MGAKAQKKVPIPAELNLDDPIFELTDDEEVAVEAESADAIDDLVQEYKNSSRKKCLFLTYLHSYTLFMAGYAL